jgi:hypothetical protein
MSKKKFVLRIDEDVYEAIEKWAGEEFRSANGQIEWMLATFLKEKKRKVGKNNNKAVTPNEEEE